MKGPGGGLRGQQQVDSSNMSVHLIASIDSSKLGAPGQCGFEIEFPQLGCFRGGLFQTHPHSTTQQMPTRLKIRKNSSNKNAVSTGPQQAWPTGRAHSFPSLKSAGEGYYTVQEETKTFVTP